MNESETILRGDKLRLNECVVVRGRIESRDPDETNCDEMMMKTG